MTSEGGVTLNAESGLTFDGTTLGVVGKITVGSSHTNSGTCSSIGGGVSNTASGACSVVGGGCSNIASEAFATVRGGLVNTASGSLFNSRRWWLWDIASQQFSTVGGLTVVLLVWSQQ
jgi:hypothetical protein